MTDIDKALALKARKAATDSRMRAAGYFSATEVAEKMQIHIGSVYRWIGDGEVSATKLAGKNYIHRNSLVQKIGADAARIFGFGVSPSPAPSAQVIEIEED